MHSYVASDRNRRTISLFFAAIMLIMALCGGTVLAATFTVCPSGCNYTRIQEAIDNASDGDTIEVTSGSYEETLIIDKSLSIEGVDTGSGLPVIDAGGEEIAVMVVAPGVLLSRFTITGANTTVVLLQENGTRLHELAIDHDNPAEDELGRPAVTGEGLTRIVIEDCTFDVRQETIILYDPADYAVINCTFTNEGGHAVAIVSSGPNTPAMNGTIAGNSISQQRGAGIRVIARTDVGMVENLTIADNTIAGAGGSIGLFIPSVGVIIRNNTVTDLSGVTDKGIYGIIVYGTSGVEVTGNHFTDMNVEIAFRFEDSSDLVVTGNTVDGNSDTGMLLLGNISGSVFIENILDDCRYNIWVEPLLLDPGELPGNVIGPTNMAGGKPVIYLEGVDDLSIEDETGIATLILYGCNNATVQNLTDLTPNGAGIMAFACDGLTIFGSSIEDMYRGVHIIGSSWLMVTDNHVSDCQDGLMIGRFHDGLISGNLVENSEDCAILTGIYLENVAIRENQVDGARAGAVMQGVTGYNNATFATNVLKNTGIAGISTEYTHGMLIEGNILVPASGVGFDIQGSTDLNITKNLVAGNAFNAFLLGESPDNVITSNMLNAGENGIVLIRDEDTPGSQDNLVADNYVNATVPVLFCLSGGPMVQRPAFMDHPFTAAGQCDAPVLVSAPDAPAPWNYECNADPSPPANTWNMTKTPGTNVILGPYLGGNFWASPDGTGFSETHPDRGDGFCNESFVINATGNTDYLPLHITGGEVPITAPAVIDAPGRYRLTNNLVNSTVATAIVITAPDVVFEGGGHTLSGINADNTGGIFCSNDSMQLYNITIRNLTVSGWDIGVTLEGVTDSVLEGITARDNLATGFNSGMGFAIADCTDVTFESCRAEQNHIGIALGHTKGCRLDNCTATGNGRVYGISLLAAQGTVMRGCVMEDNFYNLQVFEEYTVDIDTSNTVDGKPVFYLSGEENVHIGPEDNPGAVFSVDCENITIEGLALSHCGTGIGLVRTGNSTVRDCMVNRSEWGIGLVGATDTTISGTAITGCNEGLRVDAGSARTTVSGSAVSDNDIGIHVTGYSPGSLIRDNDVVANKGHGIWVGQGADASLVTGNRVYDNSGMGIQVEKNFGTVVSDNLVLDNYMDGVYVMDTIGSFLHNNTLNGNMYGAHLYKAASADVKANFIAGNRVAGIHLVTPGDSLIYNNLFNNTENVQVVPSGGGIVRWNLSKTSGTNIVNGPFLGGNFWAAPDGTGWSEITPDRGDGFCTAPFVIDANNTDYLPLHLHVPPQEATIKGWVSSGLDYGVLPVPGSRIRVALEPAGLRVPGQYWEATADAQGRYALAGLPSGVNLSAMALSPAGSPGTYRERPVQYQVGTGRLVTCMDRFTTPRVPALAPAAQVQVNWILTRDPWAVW